MSSLSSIADEGDGFLPAGKLPIQDLHLLIQTQLMICRRYESEMSRLKYPAYSILLSCIKLPDLSEAASVLESAFAKSEHAKFVHITVELIFRTCLISPLNSEELVAENGVPALVSLLEYYVSVARTFKDSKMDSRTRSTAALLTDESIAEIIAYTVRTLSGVAYYEIGRDAMKSLPQLSGFLVNWRRCIDGSLFPVRDGQILDSLTKRYALEGVVNIAMDPALQEGLVGCGVVWPMLKCALLFDPTLEQSSSDGADQDDIGLSVASVNIAARLSIRAVGVLSGLYGVGQKHAPLAASLETLLTTPISRMLRNKRTGGILRVLNANVERADIVWNVHMRLQLESLLTKLESERPEASCRAVTEELRAIDEFSYDALNQEVKIGEIYVRLFNKDGKEALVHVEKPDQFFAAIANFVARSLNNAEHAEGWVDIPVRASPPFSSSNETFATSLTSSEFLLGMNALRILCRIEGLVDDALHQASSNIPSLLLSLLELPNQSEVRLKCGVFRLFFDSDIFFSSLIPRRSILGVTYLVHYAPIKVLRMQ